MWQHVPLSEQIHPLDTQFADEALSYGGEGGVLVLVSFFFFFFVVYSLAACSVF